VPTAPGVGRTRHPRMGAAEQPAVAIWEPARNHRLTRFPSLQSAEAALSVNLLKIKTSAKTKATKEKSFTSFSARSQYFHRRNFKFHYGARAHPIGLLRYGLSPRIGRKTAYLQQSIRTIIGPCLGAHRKRCSHLRV
jgi:hypothetical protein